MQMEKETQMKKLLYLLVMLSLLLAVVPVATASAQAAVACEEDYVVQADDWLSKLADKYYGDVLAYWAIFDATNAAGGEYPKLEDPNVIEVGTRLCIPSAADAQALLAQRGGAAMATQKATSDMVDQGYKFYMITKVAGIPYFELNSKPGAQEASDELGDELIFTAPSQPLAAEQIQMMEAAIAQGVDAILVSADDDTALCPTLQKAMEQGIVVVSWDSDVQPECRQLFQQQADPEDVGRGQVRIMCDLLGGPGVCSGQVAILSAAATMTNQNTWIEWMLEEWKKPEYANMEYVGTVYGDDVDQKSYQEALGLFKSYPDLKGIISPTSVGVAAAARALEDQGLSGKILLTGLGLPSQLRQYVKSGTLPKFALWVPKDQAYLAIYMAHLLKTGELKGQPGDTFKAGRLGDFTVTDQRWVVLGPPQEFDINNIDDFDF
jgi:rhamnose transport system substrate-binding protein